MTIAAYIRVSTGSQNIDSQKKAIEQWATRNNISPDTIIWYEDTESSTSKSRSGLLSLNKAVVSGRITTVIVWKLDRLARSQKEGINLITRWCDNGARLVSITQQIDLSGSVGQMIAGLLFGIAEIELSYVKERQAMGISLAKERGLYKGRKRGTTKAKPNRAKILIEKGLNPDEVARSLGVSKRTIHRYLKAA